MFRQIHREDTIVQEDAANRVHAILKERRQIFSLECCKVHLEEFSKCNADQEFTVRRIPDGQRHQSAVCERLQVALENETERSGKEGAGVQTNRNGSRGERGAGRTRLSNWLRDER